MSQPARLWLLEQRCLFATCLFSAAPMVMQTGRTQKSDKLSPQIVLFSSLGTERLHPTTKTCGPAQAFSFQHFHVNEASWLQEIPCLAKKLPDYSTAATVCVPPSHSSCQQSHPARARDCKETIFNLRTGQCLAAPWETALTALAASRAVLKYLRSYNRQGGKLVTR